MVAQLRVTDNSVDRLIDDFTNNDLGFIPSVAKNPELCAEIESRVRALQSSHKLSVGDARSLVGVLDDSVQLVVTSPPYWTLKKYNTRTSQLGDISDYDQFIDQLKSSLSEMFRVLQPGGRAVVVVGDVCLSRRSFGRHVVFPLHSSIQEQARKVGFDNLAPIIWHKISNARYEVSNGSTFLGKPYEPNGIIKNDIEYILLMRKPGGYRKPSKDARLLSVIPEQTHREWFQQIWQITGASHQTHPAPFPIKLAERLVRMFSFVGDTVLDPFTGTGTTNIAAATWGRNSIGIDVDATYIKIARDRLLQEINSSNRTILD